MAALSFSVLHSFYENCTDRFSCVYSTLFSEVRQRNTILGSWELEIRASQISFLL